MNEEIVIFDIDGTLADVSERVHHVRKKPKNWNVPFQGMAQDNAIHSVVRLCNILYAYSRHRTGKRSRHTPAPLYRLRIALSLLWLTHPLPFFSYL